MRGEGDGRVEPDVAGEAAEVGLPAAAVAFRKGVVVGDELVEAYLLTGLELAFIFKMSLLYPIQKTVSSAPLCAEYLNLYAPGPWLHAAVLEVPAIPDSESACLPVLNVHLGIPHLTNQTDGRHASS